MKRPRDCGSSMSEAGSNFNASSSPDDLDEISVAWYTSPVPLALMREEIWKWAITVPAGSHSFIVVRLSNWGVGNGEWGIGNENLCGRYRRRSPFPTPHSPLPLLTVSRLSR